MLGRVIPPQRENSSFIFTCLKLELIFHLQEADEVNQKQLADALGIPEYTLSRLLDKLEPYGYVMREKRGLDKLVRGMIT